MKHPDYYKKKPTITRKLRAARALHGLTQVELGARLGRHQGWISALERGELLPSDIDLALLCRLLQVKPEEVFPDGSAEQRKQV